MAGLKVLVVDDATFVRDLIKRTLRNQFPGMALQDAADGKRAQGLLNRERFDLVLCDWEMPEVSGLDVLRWMRRHDAYRETPFVMVTSRGDRDHVVEAAKEGVSDYLGKPFSPESLINKVVKVMGGKLGEESQSHRGQDAFRHSADLLTGGGSQGKKPDAKPKSPAATKEAPTRSAPKKEATPPPASSGGKSSAQQVSIRFSGGQLKAVIMGVTLAELKVVLKRDDYVPTILDQAVVDMELAEGKVARLNGFVHTLQAGRQHQDSDIINLTIRWVDDDPQKMEDLSHYVARFRKPR